MQDEVLIDIADFVNDDSITPDNLEVIRELYNSIYSKTIECSNISSYIVLLMKIIDTYKNVENTSKKSLIIFVLKKYVELNVINQEESIILFSFINNILPNLIDTLISIDNKEVIIKCNNNKSCLLKLRKCFGCLGA
jgi:hypothetical protein